MLRLVASSSHLHCLPPLLSATRATDAIDATGATDTTGE